MRRLYEGKVLAGFAGSVADAFTLFEKFETKLPTVLVVTKRAVDMTDGEAINNCVN